MKITGTAIKLAIVSLVLMVFTAIIFIVFGQFRFESTTSYTAEFSNASGLKAGQFVRAGGVEVGKIDDVALTDDGRRAIVKFNVDKGLPLYQSTTASIRYVDLIGNRYINLERGTGEGSETVLPPGGFIPLARTQPALDLDALIGGFKPLFKSLDPQRVNNITQSLLTVFQGQGGTINSILQQTAELTSTLADRDQAIGEVITNLNTTLGTVVKHQKEFDSTVNNLEVLVTGLSSRADPLANAIDQIAEGSGTLAGLLRDDRPQLQTSIAQIGDVLQPLADNPANLEDLLVKLPKGAELIGRIGGIYGDFLNYYLCDVSLKLNGLQPGGPVRTVRVWQQPTGRCTPQ